MRRQSRAGAPHTPWLIKLSISIQDPESSVGCGDDDPSTMNEEEMVRPLARFERPFLSKKRK